jgi:hypothetical protein
MECAYYFDFCRLCALILCVDKALAERVAFGRTFQKSSPYLSTRKACYLSALKACRRGHRIAPHAAATLQIKPVTITTPSIAAGQASPA